MGLQFGLFRSADSVEDFLAMKALPNKDFGG
jgi:hypothetical protein